MVKDLEKVIDKIFSFFPGVKGLYGMLKQVFNLVFRRKEEKKEFKVVFVEYPHRGEWALAFLTGKCTEKTSPYAPQSSRSSEGSSSK